MHRSFRLRLVGFLICVGLLPVVSAQDAVLETSKAVERELAGGQAHSYQINLSAGQFVRVVAEQRGIDVALAIFAAGEKIAEFDSPFAARGMESVAMVAATAGSYRLEIKVPNGNAPAGRYELKIAELREATSRDRDLIRAQGLYADAVRLYQQNNPEAKKQSAEKFEEARKLWQSDGAEWEAMAATARLAGYYFSINEFPRAAEMNRQLAAFWRATGNRKNEAEASVMLGVIYHRLREYQKSLESFEQGLAFFTGQNDRDGIAKANNGLGMTYDAMKDYQKAVEARLVSLRHWSDLNNSRQVLQVLGSLTSSSSGLGDTQKAVEYAERLLRIAQGVKDRREEARAQSILGGAYLSQSNYPKAIEHRLQALALHRELGDRRSEAELCISLGITYRRLLQFTKAVESFEEAIRIFESLGYRNGMMRASNGLARVYSDRGDFRKVIELRNRTLAYYREIGDRSFSAYIMIDIARSHRELGDYVTGMEICNQVIRDTQAAGDHQNLGAAYMMLGQLFQRDGEDRKAIQSFESAIKSWQMMDYQREIAAETAAIGHCYANLGEPDKALEYARKAERLPRAVGGGITEAEAVLPIARLYAAIGDEAKAIEYFQLSISKARETNDPAYETYGLRGLGVMHAGRGDFAKQNLYFSEALSKSQQVGDQYAEARLLWEMSCAQMENDLWDVVEFWKKGGPQVQGVYELNDKARVLNLSLNNPMEAIPLANLSAYHAVNGNRALALEYGEHALLMCSSLPSVAKAQIRSTVSQVFAQLNEPQRALTLAETAYREYSGPSEIKAAVGYQLAKRLREAGRLTEAKTLLEEAISARETLLLRFKDEQTRINMFANFQILYEEYASLLMQMHGQREDQSFDWQAFQTNERSRARSLLEALIETRADIRRDVSPELLAQEQTSQKRINDLLLLEARQKDGGLEASVIDSTRKNIEAAIDDLRLLRTKIKQSSPRYASLTQPTQPTLAEIQKELLDADTMLLVYALGNQRSFLWAVTSDSFHTFQLPSRAEIAKAARSVYDLLTVSQRLSGLPPAEQQKQFAAAETNYQTEAATLSRMLLGPVAARLGNKRLLIVAPEVLQYLPFAALPEPGDKPVKAAPPLIANHEIINLPSVSTLAVLRQEKADRKPADKAVAVLADPVFSQDDPRIKAANKSQPKTTTVGSLSLTKTLRDFRGELERLFYSRDEADAIYATAPAGAIFKALDFQANRAAAINPNLSQYRIVHFATHGLLNAEHPELSGLVLSLVDEKGQPQDGFLRLHEIYNLKLNADLVVLSACQTALGKEIKGEGLIGLTRGFMYAGAPRVVASLWKVDDLATAELMKRFYRAMLQEKQRPAAALRSAQLEMMQRRQWQSPFYWAAFTLQGEWK